ncbi:MAG: allantoinase, partial [Deltaproteobacteria bacterium]|nr:allantoinase [Deltaproteobacteria bacterium]
MRTAYLSEHIVCPEGVRAGAVIVSNGRIEGVVDRAAVPSDARVRDLVAQWLLPGLVDAHVHVNEPGRTE